MSETSHKLLTASEIGCLWTTYIAKSMLRCVYIYSQQIIKDEDVRTLIQGSYEQTVQDMDTIRMIFDAENLAIPIGFTDQDVNTKADALFDDTFFLDYLNKVGKLSNTQYATFQAMCTRKDIRAFFAHCLTNASQLYDQTTETMLEKGLLIRPPNISPPQQVDFIDRTNYKSGFSLFGDKRSLNAIEISHLYGNLETNALGIMLCTGFGQTAKSQKVRDYMLRGRDISKKHVKLFSDSLVKSDIQAPMTWDASVLNSTDPPFSDKLMMVHTNLLIQASIGRYGVAAGSSLRNDLVTMYTRLTAEISAYAEDGADLMIQHEWLEEPPRTVDREQIIKKKN
ncbi:DUF3231 family protein [Salicibibacter cibarius]|uniref:DUF3231 family protein n=1 Tax=Salicibibacter cibarius TaxID=2743000 RepID=A0A7T6Z6Y4_9BACI|nr:DUF3231 family protein [Salicibibacter cibarius]QQK77962.1 DUF3231 family protein [Salicibibacter cibarius]